MNPMHPISQIFRKIFFSHQWTKQKQKTSHYYELGCSSTLPRMESKMSLQNMMKILVAIACWVSKFASQTIHSQNVTDSPPPKKLESWFEHVWPSFQFFVGLRSFLGVSRPRPQNFREVKINQPLPSRSPASPGAAQHNGDLPPIPGSRVAGVFPAFCHQLVVTLVGWRSKIHGF